MNHLAAKSIAKCISIIAQDAAKIAVLDYVMHQQGMKQHSESLAEFRSALAADSERHEQSIVRWLMKETTNNEIK